MLLFNLKRVKAMDLVATVIQRKLFPVVHISTKFEFDLD